jgi:hypothetical protein
MSVWSPHSLRDHLKEASERDLFLRAESLWLAVGPMQNSQASSRARLDGTEHCQSVEEYAWRLITKSSQLDSFDPIELFLLSCGAACHDLDKGFRSTATKLGLVHGQGAELLVEAFTEQMTMLAEPEAYAVENIISIHDLKSPAYQQKMKELDASYACGAREVNLQRLAVILKSADILHTDSSRTRAAFVDPEDLDSLGAAKNLARKCIYGWRVDGSGIHIKAYPRSARQLDALTGCAEYIRNREWPTVRDALRAYGFPHELRFDISMERMPDARQDSGPAQSRAESERLMVPLETGTPTPMPGRPPAGPRLQQYRYTCAAVWGNLEEEWLAREPSTKAHITQLRRRWNS